ncbi:MAG TPA: hypothetical protein VK978_02450 [Candidatus Saccharimonadales bacterium]|nr:hypothetical protein [Candidatus Saccharimonadales bacterium]
MRSHGELSSWMMRVVALGLPVKPKASVPYFGAQVRKRLDAHRIVPCSILYPDGCITVAFLKVEQSCIISV